MCCAGQPRDAVFRERGIKEPRSRKLELHLNGRMLVNVATKHSYWTDLFYYIFQKDHFLSCLYCDYEHPFTKRERKLVYFTMCATVCMCATVFRPPSSCEDWLDASRPGYKDHHTWGRVDAGWTELCTAGVPPPDANTREWLIIEM
jgi:hypothetical protein